MEFIRDHDVRLRRVVALAHRDSRSHDDNVKLSKCLSVLLLRWSCNARDVHLLRGCGARLVQEAAEFHDRSIKEAFACITGHAIAPPDGNLGEAGV